MKALFFKELRSFLSSIIGYVFICVFLLLNSLFLWVYSSETNILEVGSADLRAFFNLSPFIFIILIPAITMRSFAEEKRTGTIELLFTRPFSDFNIILAKYLAGVVLVAISVLPTLIYYLTVHMLGDPVGIVDDGATITSYIGLVLVGACLVSLGIFASSLTNNQIVAFILGVVLCWFLFVGLDLMASFSQLGGLDYVLRNLGLGEHYESIQKGVIDTRDLVFFVCFTVFFLMLTFLRLNARKNDSMGLSFKKMSQPVLRARLVLIGLFLIGYIFSFYFLRFDLTEDKRYSLSENTIALLEDETVIEDRIFFKIYLDGELPADIRKIKNSIQEKLDEFAIYAGDKIQYEFIDPNGDEDPDANLALQKNIYSGGIQPCGIRLTSSGNDELLTIWPGAIIDYKGITVDHIQFFDNKLITDASNLRGLADATINKLEFILVSAIKRVTGDEKKTVSFLHGHGELTDWQTADVRNGLKRYYLVEDVEISGQINALDNSDALVIAKPTKIFSEKDKFVIDQYIMKGGKVLWFVDPLEINLDSLYRTGQTFGTRANLNIEKDMLYKYGVRINNDILLDEDCTPLYIPGHPNGVVPWYFYPMLERVPHPITKNVDPIKSEYTASIDLVNEGDGIERTVLLKSSYNSRTYRAPARINYGIVDVDPNFNDGTQGDFPVAVLLEGQFKSAFENRGISDAFLNSPDYQTDFLSVPNKMLVVADGDIIRNEVDSAIFENRMQYRPIPLHVDIYQVTNQNGTPKYIYGNRDFVLNSIDYLLDDNSLLDIRNKSITLRNLDMAKVADEKNLWKFVNIAIPVILILILAVAQFFVRRYRYTTSI